MRECMQRVDSTVGPPTAPVEGMIPLKFYRHMRRIVRGKSSHHSSCDDYS